MKEKIKCLHCEKEFYSCYHTDKWCSLDCRVKDSKEEEANGAVDMEKVPELFC